MTSSSSTSSVTSSRWPLGVIPPPSGSFTLGSTDSRHGQESGRSRPSAIGQRCGMSPPGEQRSMPEDERICRPPSPSDEDCSYFPSAPATRREAGNWNRKRSDPDRLAVSARKEIGELHATS